MISTAGSSLNPVQQWHLKNSVFLPSQSCLCLLVHVKSLLKVLGLHGLRTWIQSSWVISICLQNSWFPNHPFLASSALSGPWGIPAYGQNCYFSLLYSSESQDARPTANCCLPTGLGSDADRLLQAIVIPHFPMKWPSGTGLVDTSLHSCSSLGFLQTHKT